MSGARDYTNGKWYFLNRGFRARRVFAFRKDG